MTPLWVLYLIERISKVDLPHVSEGDWQAIKGPLLRQLTGLVLGADLADKAAEAVRANLDAEWTNTSIGAALVGEASLHIMRRRYPEYSTLMRTPQWEKRVDTYIGALQNSELSLACKRGAKVWRPPDSLAETAFGTSRMNLSGTAFQGYGSLIEIDTKGRGLPLEIRFKRHRLEDAIRDFILAGISDPTCVTRVEGRDCPFVVLSDLTPQLLTLGYTVTELGKIIAIGQARQSFERMVRDKEEVLYCHIIDIEVLKERCRARLDELLEEIREYRRVPGYSSQLDPEPIRRRIDEMEDDAAFDEIMSGLDAEFRRNHGLLEGFYGDLAKAITGNHHKLRQIEDLFSSSSVAQQLKAPLPKSCSPWGSSLGKFPITNLKATVAELSRDIVSARKGAGGYLSRYQYQKGQQASESLALLIEGHATNGELGVRVSELFERAKTEVGHLKSLAQWRELLVFSDELFEELMGLAQPAGTHSRITELLARFEGVADSIDKHIQERNVNGLASYPQFHRSLQEIKDELQEYLRSIRKLFDERKEAVNQFLTDMLVTERVKATFDFTDPASAYEYLFSEGVRLLHEQLTQRDEELVVQQRELLYAADVLQVIQASQKADLLGLISAGTALFRGVANATDSAWLRNAVEKSDNDAVQWAAGRVKQAMDSIDQVRRTVKQSRQPKPPSSSEAKRVHAMLQDGGVLDLQEIVLRLLDEGEHAESALDSTLEALVELFRIDSVKIEIQRRLR